VTPATRSILKEIEALAQRGLGYREAAWALEARPRYVANLAKKHGIAFKLKQRGPKSRDEGRVPV